MNRTKLEVIGAGQMRTGTNSLKLALEILYGGKCYHMFEVFDNHRDHFKLWKYCLDRGSMDRSTCDKLFKGYCAAVDYPAAMFYKDLIHIYPDAKVILTERDSKTWVKNVKNTTLVFFEPITFFISGVYLFNEVFEKLIFHAFHLSKKELEQNDDLLQKAFEKYNEEVKNYVPKDRLLVFKISDGWKPLCKFLDLPVPNEPFPHVNKTDEFHERRMQLIKTGIIKLGSMLAILAVSGAILAKIYFGF